jgi:hypothetical protein
LPATSSVARLPNELREVIAGLAVSVGLGRTNGGERSHCRAVNVSRPAGCMTI